MAGLSEREMCLEIERGLNRMLLSSNNVAPPASSSTEQPGDSSAPPFVPPFAFTAEPVAAELSPQRAPQQQNARVRKERKKYVAPGKRNVKSAELNHADTVESNISAEGDPKVVTPVGTETSPQRHPPKLKPDRKTRQSKSASETKSGPKRTAILKNNSDATPATPSQGGNNEFMYLQDLEKHLLERPNETPAAKQPFEEVGSALIGNRNPSWSSFDEQVIMFRQQRVLLLKKKSKRFPRAHFYCHLCHRHFDDAWYVEKHLENEQHVNKKTVLDMRLAVKNLPYPTDTQCRAIGELIEHISKEQSLSADEVELRKSVAQEVELFVTSALPDAKLCLHGSSISGFGMKGSNVNLDLCPIGKAEGGQLFVDAGDLILNCPQYTKVEKDYLSKVPRIRFTDVTSKLPCEISLNNSNSQKTSRLLGDYASMDPRVRQLGVAFRYWGKVCGLDRQDRGTLPPHSFAIMTVFFLQQCKPCVLPVLHELEGSSDSESYMNPRNMEHPWVSKNERSVGHLWVEMLRFYSAEFKLHKQVVCIRKSKPVLISEKHWNKRYIAIEDPYSSRRNLARSIPSEQMCLFLKRCIRTSAIYFLLPQLQMGPLFTQLPGPQLYTANCDSESDSEPDDDNAKGKAADKRANETGGAKATDDEDDEDDDDASLCSSGPGPDELDPDLDLAEVVKVISNMDLGPEPTKTSGGRPHRKKEPSMTVAEQFVKPGPPTPQRFLDELELLSESDFIYQFSRKTLANDRCTPLICAFCQKSGHLQEKCPEQRLPEIKPLPPMTRSYMKLLNDLCRDVMSHFSLQPQEEMHRNKLLQELESFIRELYKDARLTLYGSSCSGFGLVRSDLDICLTFESSKDGKELCHAKMIEELAEKLQTHPDLHKIIAITSAKVPIVKFFHAPSQLEGDVSLYNTLAQHNTKLLKVYSEIDSRVRVLGYTLKQFAKTCGIGDASRGSLSSYAYMLMMLYYLQQCNPPVIPVLQELYPEGEKKPELMIEGWNAWFFSDIDRLQAVWSEFGQNNESVGELWLGLLKFYTQEFNFKEYVVCIRQRKPLTRLQKMWTSRCIAIEDPFELDHNLGNGVSRKMNTYIMKALIKGRSLFGTPVCRKLPANCENYINYFFDRRLLTDGQPPNDRGCRLCGKIGHRVKECPRRRSGGNDSNGGMNERSGNDRPRERGNRQLWSHDAGRAGGNWRNKMMGNLQHQQPQHQQLQHQQQQHQQPQHQHLQHQQLQHQQLQHQQQQQQRRKLQPMHHARGRSMNDQQHNVSGESCLLGSSPPIQHLPCSSVAQAQLQQTLQDMMGFRQQQGGQSYPAAATPPWCAAAPFPQQAPARPPPFPGANGQAPPHPDVQALLYRMQQQDRVQQQFAQWQPAGPRHAAEPHWSGHPAHPVNQPILPASQTALPMGHSTYPTPSASSSTLDQHHPSFLPQLLPVGTPQQFHSGPPPKPPFSVGQQPLGLYPGTQQQGGVQHQEEGRDRPIPQESL